MQYIFYVFSFFAVFSTICVVLQKNAVYALLYLIISFLSISGIFFLLGAFFMGALQVIIYAGAIMVLFVFVIMMLNLGEHYDLQEKKYLQFIYWIGPSILSFFLFIVMAYVIFFLKGREIEIIETDSKKIGIFLFGPYMLLVECLSMLLLSSLVVVFHLGKCDKKYSNTLLQDTGIDKDKKL